MKLSDFIMMKTILAGMVAFGFYFLWDAVQNLLWFKQGRQWRTTTGKIVESTVKKRRSFYQYFRTMYWSVINYEYFVDGQKFLSKRVRFGELQSFNPFSYSSIPHPILGAFPVGKETSELVRLSSVFLVCWALLN